MKVKAHIMLSKGYGLGVSASQWLAELMANAEESNREMFGEDYMSREKHNAVVTVEFEVPDSVFIRETPPVIRGKLKGGD